MSRRPLRSVQTSGRLLAILAVIALPLGAAATRAAPANLPEIRMTGENRVPRCVTPDRLMAFLKTRNSRPDPRFRDIAHWYKHWGEAWKVRWDYAFFQMAIETNFLTYRQPNGRMGDVDPRQNNFAGIGTTGGGVPGDRFPDVKTGVLAQIQHLVAYSGERLANPVAPRTQLKQEDIVALSLRLNRPVKFSDLSGRWAVDRKYGSSIAWVAGQFRDKFCRNPDVAPPEEVAIVPAKPQRAVRPAGAPPVQPAASQTSPAVALQPAPMDAPLVAPQQCLIQTASYGGQKTILIRRDLGHAMELTALSVLDGFEKSMTDSYIAARAPGGTPVGTFHDQTAAVTKARQLCPPAAAVPGREASAR
jgi:hypothetical protein